jgi:hypothetical protein
VTFVDPEYVEARRVLLDALEALAPHAPALVIAGAQAVYLRVGDGDLAVAPYTTDGDIAVDPESLAPDPTIEAAMNAAGFELALQGGHIEPGIWVAEAIINDQKLLIRLTSSSRRASRLREAGAAPAWDRTGTKRQDALSGSKHRSSITVQ